MAAQVDGRAATVAVHLSAAESAFAGMAVDDYQYPTYECIGSHHQTKVSEYSEALNYPLKS